MNDVRLGVDLMAAFCPPPADRLALAPNVQARLLARTVRGDADAHLPFRPK